MIFDTLAAYQVDECLYAGEKPYSLFDQEMIMDELKQHGIEIIINLMEEYEYIRYPADEFYTTFNVLHFPIADNTVPDMGLIKQVLSCIDQEKKTYVHCNLGLGRTGIIIASYLHKVHGYESELILEKIAELKMDSKLADKQSPITQDQINFVKKLMYKE